ncbi:MAG: META domain-containing protein [Roseicyclus sp.]
MWHITLKAAPAFAALLALPALAQPMPADVTGDVRAQGNEPFWSAEVSGEDLLVRRLGLPDFGLSVVARKVQADGSLAIRAATSSPALTAVLTLGPGPCADTMADQTYPFTAELDLGDAVLAGCAGDPRALLSGVGTWRVETLAGTPVLPETEITLAFDATDRLSGSGGCNRFTATYAITGEGLSVGPVAATRVACPDPLQDQEVRLFELLAEVASFDIREDGGLTLVTRDGDRIAARAP